MRYAHAICIRCSVVGVIYGATILRLSTSFYWSLINLSTAGNLDIFLRFSLIASFYRRIAFVTHRVPSVCAPLIEVDKRKQEEEETIFYAKASFTIIRGSSAWCALGQDAGKKTMSGQVRDECKLAFNAAAPDGRTVRIFRVVCPSGTTSPSRWSRQDMRDMPICIFAYAEEWGELYSVRVIN